MFIAPWSIPDEDNQRERLIACTFLGVPLLMPLRPFRGGGVDEEPVSDAVSDQSPSVARSGCCCWLVARWSA